MTLSVSSPVTGAAITGLTSPTYTLADDVALTDNALQYAVTALGGTQSTVLTSNIDTPFTVTVVRPSKWKSYVMNLVGRAPVMNRINLIIRKGLASNAADGSSLTGVGNVTISVNVPAGAVSVDPNSVRAMLSLASGVFEAKIGGIFDTLNTGV